MLDGKVYTVQYFERAVFEMHPENKAPYDVLLSQLGTYQYNRKYTKTTPPGTTVLQAGQWGGQSISLNIDGQGIRLEYDCAHGTMEGASILSRCCRKLHCAGHPYLEHGGPISGTDQVDPSRQLHRHRQRQHPSPSQ